MRLLGSREPMWKVMEWAARESHVVVNVLRGGIAPTGPQLIIGTDLSPAVGFALLSQTRRDDVYFIGAPGWKRVGQIVSDRCLPAFTVPDFRTNPKEALWAQFVYRFGYGIDLAAVAKKNLETILRAAEIVTKGGSLLLKPTGGYFGGVNNWREGVGLIMSNIGDVPAQVIFFRLQGDRREHLSRILLNPDFFRWLRKPLTVTLEFSDPIPLSEFKDESTTYKQINRRLKERYLELYGSL